MYFVFFFFNQKTAYEMRISDWSSDVCSSDLPCLALIQPYRGFQCHSSGPLIFLLRRGAGFGRNRSYRMAPIVLTSSTKNGAIWGQYPRALLQTMAPSVWSRDRQCCSHISDSRRNWNECGRRSSTLLLKA